MVFIVPLVVNNVAADVYLSLLMFYWIYYGGG